MLIYDKSFFIINHQSPDYFHHNSITLRYNFRVFFDVSIKHPLTENVMDQ